MDLIIGLVLAFIFLNVFFAYSSYREGKKEKTRKTSRILFANATTIERNVREEEVFKTLDEAGIELNFLK
ncbi:MAG: hypothetical protein J6A29_01080 [Clostridia bacterium]|nr:hypothetical protein [Clostridia bacterium]